LFLLFTGAAALFLKRQPGQCANIECGELKCPAGFSAVDHGGCCPVCHNPDVVVENVATGANGNNGGKQSVVCPGIWCFPTMCDDPGRLVAPTSGGNCCPRCAPK